jgi:hypothetical protein
LTTPISSMPDVLQTAMVINPLRYALDLTKRVYWRARASLSI